MAHSVFRGTATMHPRRFFVVPVLIIFIALLTGCSALSGSSDGVRAAPEVAPSDMGAFDGDLSDINAENSIATPSVIRTGSMGIESAEPQAAAEEIVETATSVGGKIDHRSISTDPTSENALVTHVDLVLRIPEAQFEETMAAFQSVGTVITDTRSDQDVTAHHVDLTARVSSLAASIQRLEDLIGDAQSVSDLIEIEAALADRQAEHDSLTAQLSALEDQVAYATVNITIHLPGTLPAEGPQNFWEGLLVGLDSIVKALSATAIALGVLLPWLIIAGIIVTIAIVVITRRRKRLSAGEKPEV